LPVRPAFDRASAWRRTRYTLLAPFYDLGAAAHVAWRARAVDLLALRPGERVLVVGVGTGRDLDLLPPEVRVVAVDLVPAMLRRARARVRAGGGRAIDFRVMDGECLEFRTGSFDAVLLHQVLEVAARPAACLREAARVLAPGGRLTVFDKFAHHPLSSWRRALARAGDVCFTTTKLAFEDLLRESSAPLSATVDVHPPRGAFRLLLMNRDDTSASAPPPSLATTQVYIGNPRLVLEEGSP
jgi:ubiquinone/menaquinone biosynthesis C-methylase UbiE